MLNKNSGFTFIEVVVSVFVIALVVAGVFGVIQSTVVQRDLAASQLQAAYLAQAGIEAARNQRDNNWLSGADWDLISIPDGNFLNNKFTRTVSVDTTEDDQALITVTVSWNERGTDHDFIVEARLYNWYEE